MPICPLSYSSAGNYSIWTMLIEWGSNCQRMVCSKRGFSQQIDGMYTPLNKLVRRVSSMLANRWELGMTTSSTIGHPKKEEVETQEILGNCIYTLGLGLSLSFRWFLWIVTAAPPEHPLTRPAFDHHRYQRRHEPNPGHISVASIAGRSKATVMVQLTVLRAYFMIYTP